MLNIICQRSGAHSETLPLFVELLDGDCAIFFPFGDEFTSHEQYIYSRYGTKFVKNIHELHEMIKCSNDHGILTFNTAAEFKEEWAIKTVSLWTGKVVVYHHEFEAFERNDIAQFYAHPFMSKDAYLIPVSTVYRDTATVEPTANCLTTIVLPNWTRPGQLANKNLSLLSHLSSNAKSRKLTFIMTGMTLEVMRQALSVLIDTSCITIEHRPNIERLGSLLKQPHSYVMPLIHPSGRYARLGLTGSIPLAINYDCPLIICSSLARTYDLNVFVDEENILDTLPESTSDYLVRRSTSADQRSAMLAANRLKFRGLLSKISNS